MLIPGIWLAQVVAFGVGLVGPWRDPPESANDGRVARPIRMGISLSLVVVALLLYSAAEAHSVYAIYAGWIALGMIASFFGDLIMAKLIPVPVRLIGGMVAFGIGHAFYITGYVRTMQFLGTPFPTTGLWIGLAVYALATVGGWALLVRNPDKPLALNIGALVYGAWIGVMASFAFGLAMHLGGWWWFAAAGGLIFVASDFLIGLSEIRGVTVANSNDWIWLTYIGGQMGIIYAGWA